MAKFFWSYPHGRAPAADPKSPRDDRRVIPTTLSDCPSEHEALRGACPGCGREFLDGEEVGRAGK